jgi:hypothetical protein
MSSNHHPLQISPGTQPGRVGQRRVALSHQSMLRSQANAPCRKVGAFVFSLKEVTVCSKANRKTISMP